MKNQTWIWSSGFLVAGSLLLRSGDQKSHLVLAGFRFGGFIFILYWFSVVIDKWPEGKSEATKRLMGHKKRSCIIEPCQFLTRRPTSRITPSNQLGKQGFLLGVWFLARKTSWSDSINGQGYVLSLVQYWDHRFILGYSPIQWMSHDHRLEFSGIHNTLLLTFLPSNFTPHTNG